MVLSKGLKKSETFTEFFKTLFWAGALAILVRTFLYQPFNIPSGSMIPTLLVGDYLFVSKFSYGYTHFSLPFSPPIFEGRIWGSQPKTGEVVVFRGPQDEKTDYIKRLVGQPGDRIQMIQGVLHINDQPVTLEKVGDYIDDEGFRYIKYWETLPNGVKHAIIKHDAFGFGPMDNTPVYEVPKGHYFMVGDNRDRSLDSRYLDRFGYIPEQNLIGRAEIIFFSTDGSARWYQPWVWLGAMRFGRIASLIR